MTAIQKSEDTPTAKRRKEQVLAAALECFRREGFHGAAMSKIAAASGMSSGHIYHYFGSKEGIIATIAERERNEMGVLLDEVKEAAKSGDPVSALIERIPESITRYTDSGNAAFQADILAEVPRNPTIAELIRRNDAEMREKLYDVLGDDSPEMKSRFEIVGALISGISGRVLVNPELGETLDTDMLCQVVRYVLTAPVGGSD